MPLVISDASTLIHLATIGRLALLNKFYAQITITPSVWREVVEEGAGRSGAQELANARAEGWLEVIAPRDEAISAFTPA